MKEAERKERAGCTSKNVGSQMRRQGVGAGAPDRWIRGSNRTLGVQVLLQSLGDAVGLGGIPQREVVEGGGAAAVGRVWRSVLADRPLGGVALVRVPRSAELERDPQRHDPLRTLFEQVLARVQL